MIALFSPVLRHTGYGLTWKDGIVMTWGGLRGAVGLMLALQVAHHDRIDQESVGVRVGGLLSKTNMDKVSFLFNLEFSNYLDLLVPILEVKTSWPYSRKNYCIYLASILLLCWVFDNLYFLSF